MTLVSNFLVTIPLSFLFLSFVLLFLGKRDEVGKSEKIVGDYRLDHFFFTTTVLGSGP